MFYKQFHLVFALRSFSTRANLLIKFNCLSRILVCPLGKQCRNVWDGKYQTNAVAVAQWGTDMDRTHNRLDKYECVQYGAPSPVSSLTLIQFLFTRRLVSHPHLRSHVMLAPCPPTEARRLPLESMSGIFESNMTPLNVRLIRQLSQFD